MSIVSVLGLVFLFKYLEACGHTCWFVYDNRNGDKNSSPLWEKTQGPNKQISGVFIIKGVFKSDGQSRNFDYLRFRKGNDGKVQSLVFNYDMSKWMIYGETNGVYETYKQEITGVATTGEFRFKFTTLITDKITIFYTDEKKTNEELLFNYNDNWSVWKFMPVSESTNIISDLFETNYKYILGCPSNTPIICDITSPSKFVLEQQYALNCTGSGSPPLSVTWSSESSDAVVTNATNAVVTTKSAVTEHILTSILTIPSFSVLYIAKITCVITSTDAGANAKAQKVWDITYNEDYAYNTYTLAYYSKSADNQTMTWTVTGWPLDDLAFNTSLSDAQRKPDGKNVTSNPPMITYTLYTKDAIVQEKFNVTIYNVNTNNVLKTWSYVMVGAQCVGGEYGAGTICKTCPSGTNSPPRSDSIDHCVSVTSNCLSGYWGVGNSCSKCATGKTSKPGSVKQSDCYTPQEPYNPQKSTGSVNLGVIVGGAVGGIVCIIVVILLVFICHVRAKKLNAMKEKASELRSNSFVRRNSAAEPQDYEEEPRMRGNRLQEPEDLYDNQNLKSLPVAATTSIDDDSNYIELDSTTIRNNSATDRATRDEKRRASEKKSKEAEVEGEGKYTSIQPERQGMSIKESTIDDMGIYND